MSQIFPKSANAWSKASIFAVLGLVVTLGAAVGVLQRSDFVTTANTNREQPVQFSHQHHVGGIGIDCRYCHSSVEVSYSAGIPPTKTCINCHSQIWSTSPYLEPVRSSFRDDKPLQWLRVHDLPDFVYFNHSIHVAKGVACTTCHGPINKMPLMYQGMPLTMKWCLDCHRDPVKNLRPREEVTNVLWQPPADLAAKQKEWALANHVQSKVSCSNCHR